MRLIIWIVFLATLALIWSRELLAYAKARRSAPDDDTRLRLIKRFRRRSLGVFVLLLLGTSVDLSNYLDPVLAPEEMLGYYGMCLIELIWLGLIASRDITDVLEVYANSQTEMTIQALVEIEQQIEAAKDPDERKIPILKFPAEGGKNENGISHT